MRHLYDGTNPKAYILQSFEEHLDDYYINVETKGEECVLTFACDFDQADKNISNFEYLQSITIQAGSWWVCHYSGETEDWLLIRSKDKADAVSQYKRLYQRYFKAQTWIHAIKI